MEDPARVRDRGTDLLQRCGWIAQLAETQVEFRNSVKSQVKRAITLKFELRCLVVLIRNARRPCGCNHKVNTCLNRMTAVHEQYHRLYAVCQDILAEFTRTALTIRLEGIIK